MDSFSPTFLNGDKIIIVIYRFVQEYMANVHKHAEARQVAIAIKVFTERAAITLEDNGKGFDPEEIKDRPRERRGLGVASIKERLRMLGSRFSLTSRPGHGTRLNIEVLRTNDLPRALERYCAPSVKLVCLH
jgi:signal transduction histidine kinase